MRKTLSLILPVLLPSWRFFKSIEPSPRVQWAIFSHDAAKPKIWRDLYPRPLTLSPIQILARLFWNPSWNETLFVVSCAERIQEDPTPHSVTEIRQRVLTAIPPIFITDIGQMAQFRLVFTTRVDTKLQEDIVFTSDVFSTNPINVK